MKEIFHEMYVSLEVAQMLKQAGFNWECQYSFCRINGNDELCNRLLMSNWNATNEVSAPTLAVAHKWLRDVHGYDISINVVQLPHGYIPGLWRTDEKGNVRLVADSFTLQKEHDAALLVGIKKCLTYILED